MSSKCVFIMDKSTCDKYVSWFYSDTTERKPLFDLHILSAMEKADDQQGLIIIPSTVSNHLRNTYDDRPLVIDTFIEALTIESFADGIGHVDSLKKTASIFSIRSKHVVIVSSDDFTYDQLQDCGFEVIKLVDLQKKMESCGVSL